MNLNVNLKDVVKHNLTIHQFAVLQSILEEDNELFLYLTTTIPFNDFRLLEDKGIIKVIEEPIVSYKSITIRVSSISPKVNLNKHFEEFWNAFPRWAHDRALRTSDLDTIMAKNAKKKYLSIVKTLEMHNKLMKGLTNEVIFRNKTLNMQYMNNILSWLNQGGWEKYSDMIIDSPTNDYGTKEL